MAKDNKNVTVTSSSAKRRERVEAAQKKQKIAVVRNTVIAVLVILLAVFIPLGIRYINNNGLIKRTKTVMKTENYSLNGTMATYYFYRNYQNFINTYSDYLSYFGLDTESPLKSQKYTDDKTWYDYFLEKTDAEAHDVLLFCEYARENGISLDEDDYSEMEVYFTQVKEYADKSDLSMNEYFRNVYGMGVTEADVRSCIEMSTLASKGYELMMERFEYTDSDIDKYYSENTNSFLKVDYKSYAFKYSVPETSSTATSSSASSVTSSAAETSSAEAPMTEDEIKAKGYADALALASSADDFDAKLREYLETVVYGADTDGITEEDKAKITTDISGTVKTAYAYSETDKISKWAFDSAREIGDITVVKGTGNYTVYILTKTSYRDESLTKSVRHILLTEATYGSEDDDEALLKAAKALLSEWEAGAATEDSFAALAIEKSEDTGSKEKGGLYENVKSGEMDTNFDKWLYDSARHAGETGIVETTYGQHIVYFVGDGLPVWKLTAIDGLESDYYDAAYEAYETVHPVTTDEAQLKKIGA